MDGKKWMWFVELRMNVAYLYCYQLLSIRRLLYLFVQTFIVAILVKSYFFGYLPRYWLFFYQLGCQLGKRKII